MLRHGNAVLRCRRSGALSAALGRHTIHQQHQQHTAVERKKVYMVAGEASGDAIGAKVIQALERKRAQGDPHAQQIEFRGVGGPLMCAAGGFDSLFSMQELSVMGLVEVLPSLWRIRRRLHDTLADIKQFQPDVVLTIDSKGFTFRILKALYADPATRDSITRMHYVAPSVWAYKHRQKKERDFTELSRLLHRMFTILPFEESLFMNEDHKKDATSDGGDQGEREGADGKKAQWCRFVGHPAVEDFLEYHGQFDRETAEISARTSYSSSRPQAPLDTIVPKRSPNSDALLDFSKYEYRQLEQQGQLFESLMESGRNSKNNSDRAATRAKFVIPEHAFVVCALVGSRQNEVTKNLQLVLEGIKRFHQSHVQKKDARQIFVVFPTISSIGNRVKSELLRESSSSHTQLDTAVLTDLSASERIQLFQSADAAVAVSGTIVMETTLAALPTVVVYRANRITELIAQQLAAVRFVSIPNLLLGRWVVPELLFRECTPANIDAALRKIHEESVCPTAAHLGLPMALSTLVKWGTGGGDRQPKPLRASDAVAKEILDALGGHGR